jgi:hypothetical protein
MALVYKFPLTALFPKLAQLDTPVIEEYLLQLAQRP